MLEPQDGPRSAPEAPERGKKGVKKGSEIGLRLGGRLGPHFGPILVPFWADLGSFLDPLEADFGWMLAWVFHRFGVALGRAFGALDSPKTASEAHGKGVGKSRRM